MGLLKEATARHLQKPASLELSLAPCVSCHSIGDGRLSSSCSRFRWQCWRVQKFQSQRFGTKLFEREGVRMSLRPSVCTAVSADAAEVFETSGLPNVSADLRDPLQQFLDETFLLRRSCDRHGPMPGKLRLRQVFQVPRTGSEVWDHFVAQRKALQEETEVLEELGLSSTSLKPPVRTAAAMAMMTANADSLQLEGSASSLAVSSLCNECYLLHGTCPADAVSIAKSGFNLSFSDSTEAQVSGGKKKDKVFGSGIYFAEASSKADEYSSDGSGRRSRSKKGALLAMLLCRVALGRIQRVVGGLGLAGAEPGFAEALESKGYHSLLGDLEQSAGTYREFVVPRTTQVFPEFLLVYQRLYGPQGGPFRLQPGPKSARPR
eukprot:TRINITY_DN6408_c0_g2_i1.p1 TRINITY_DN6408_c0_g2~~TRINITY_DN6408_c0_g2_i1.p1  ORF type:complete len:377 (+),score=64.66 TRINITY_DN6408_c0_g2_i1:110-1240(+)